MSQKRPKMNLAESWVVEKDDYSPDTSPGRQTRGDSRAFTSPEPEFVMPSLDVDSMDGSWAESPSHIRHRNRKAPSDRMQESRRINRASKTFHGSSEKRSRPKSATPSITKADSIPSHQAYDSPSFLDLSLNHIAEMLSWLFDILVGAVRILKTPISYLLAVWLLFCLGLMARNMVTNSVHGLLTPICRIPGSSMLNLPFCPTTGDHVGLPSPVEFEQLMSVQSNFEKVLEESAGSISLPYHMKRGEISIRELRLLVQHSQLQSKDKLVQEFDGFIEQARSASYELQRFNSHVGRAVDIVISITKWTSKILDGIEKQEAARGAISGFINDNLIALFQPAKLTEELVLNQYIKHAQSVGDEISRLVIEAQSLLRILDNLENSLDVIHDLSTRENSYTEAAKEEILASLWTMIGGNGSKLNKVDRRLNLLKQVGAYRKQAFAHVSGTILQLQAMGAGLEDLLIRVEAPDNMNDVGQDVPLSVHIESIQSGVERLEKERQNVRRVEDNFIKQTLDRGKQEGIMIDGLKSP